MKTKITLNLLPDIVKKLDYSAKTEGVNRQDFLEKLVTEKVSKVTLDEEEDFELSTQYIQNYLKESFNGTFWVDIQNKIEKLKPGEETSLKKLVGKDLWAKIKNDTLKRNVGKLFKRFIGTKISGLIVGRMKSNNEQQYERN